MIKTNFISYTIFFWLIVGYLNYSKRINLNNNTKQWPVYFFMYLLGAHLLFRSLDCHSGNLSKKSSNTVDTLGNKSKNVVNNSVETYFDISLAKLCKGGPYTWQGNSERAQKCRALYSTPEGKVFLDSTGCGYGLKGMERADFQYNPVSNSIPDIRCKSTYPSVL